MLRRNLIPSQTDPVQSPFFILYHFHHSYVLPYLIHEPPLLSPVLWCGIIPFVYGLPPSNDCPSNVHKPHDLGSICYGGHSGQEKPHTFLSWWMPKTAQTWSSQHLPGVLQDSFFGLSRFWCSISHNLQAQSWVTAA